MTPVKLFFDPGRSERQPVVCFQPVGEGVAAAFAAWTGPFRKELPWLFCIKPLAVLIWRLLEW